MVQGNTMYISKILLDVRIPLVRRELAGLNLLHATLSEAVNGGKFLYRLDNVPLDKNGYMQPLVLVSDKKPEVSGTGTPADFFTAIENYEYQMPVRKGMIFKFFLKANPSTKIFFLHSEIHGHDLQVKWLESESSSKGFQLLDCSVREDGYISCIEKKIKLLSAIFEGSMKVTDEKKFQKMLYQGIGHGREYGLGLVSVESYGCKNRNMAEEMKAYPERMSEE